MRAIASCLPFLFLCLVASCARKLPGPDECRAFALASVGVKPGTPASALDAVPMLAEKAEEITRQCLTTPYDYELMNCLIQGGGQKLCARAFQARHVGALR
jgi:hypothetical protein